MTKVKLKAVPVNIDKFKDRVDAVMEEVSMQYLALGEIIWEAGQQTEAASKALKKYIMNQYGLTQSDLQAAEAGFYWQHPELGDEDTERIPAGLLLLGAKSSKILAMDEDTAKRLLSGDVLPILKKNRKDVDHKAWKDMTPEQRNLLLDKGGNIRSIDEQRDAMNHEKKKIEFFKIISADKDKDGFIYLWGTDSNRRGQTRPAALAEILEGLGYTVSIKEEV